MAWLVAVHRCRGFRHHQIRHDASSPSPQASPALTHLLRCMFLHSPSRWFSSHCALAAVNCSSYHHSPRSPQPARRQTGLFLFLVFDICFSPHRKLVLDYHSTTPTSPLQPNAASDLNSLVYLGRPENEGGMVVGGRWFLDTLR